MKTLARVSKKKETAVIENTPKPSVPQYTNLYTIKQIRCFVDGHEIKIKDIKKMVFAGDVDEIYIFGISNKLYKEIISFLKEEQIKYTEYYRSRIVLEN